MNIKVGREKLLDVIRKVQSVIDRKTTSTVLSNILIGCRPDDPTKMQVVATDFETSFRGVLEVGQVDQPGEFVVNGKSFYDIVRSLGDKEVVIRTEENRVLLSAGKSSFSLNTFPVEDYPKIPDIGAVRFAEFPREVLSKLIRSTAFSISSDHSRPNLNGVYFTLEAVEGAYQLVMVSTDGHRLSKIEARLPLPVDGDPVTGAVIIHRKGLGVMKAMMESSEAYAEVGLDERNLVFRVGDSAVSIRPIEETFPEYRNVIPKEFPSTTRVTCQQLEAMIKRVSVLNSPQVKAVRMRIAPGALEATSNNPELGEGRDELTVEYDGEAIVAAFNYQFFLEALANIEEREVSVEFIDAISACRLVPVVDPPEDDSVEPVFDAMYIIMPMRM
jgi:DNA polymerase III subunit beta